MKRVSNDSGSSRFFGVKRSKNDQKQFNSAINTLVPQREFHATPENITVLIESLDQPCLRKNALSELARLSASLTNHTIIRESGAIAQLISCLQYDEGALPAIIGLSKNTENHAVMHANRCVEALVQRTLSQKNANSLTAVLFLFQNEAYRQDIVSKTPCSVIGGLIRCVCNHHQSVSLDKAALSLLCEMKLEEADLKRVRSNDGINTLVKSLMNLELRGLAVKLLLELVKDSLNLQNLFDANGMTHLRSLLTDNDSQTRDDAVSLLQALQAHQRASTLTSIPYESLHFTVKKLGQGSFGQVVRGEWLHHTPVAIKILSNDEASHREAILHSSLNHPNIVALYGVYQAPGQYGLVLELLSDSLFQVIKRLTPKKRQAYAMDISRGLAYLNTELVVHADLKPQNILVGEGRAKLADFGLSRRLSSKSELMTGQVTQVCTWEYAAPEVVQYNQASFASDVWSFSMVLWEMAMGQWPYNECNNTNEVKHRIIVGIKPGELQAVEEKTSKPYADLIAACWEDRAERRPSIQSVVDSVSRLPK